MTDVETDYGPNTFGEDLPVGLAFLVGVAESASATGQIRVRVGEYLPGRKNGTSLVVEPVVDVALPYRLAGMAPPSGPGTIEVNVTWTYQGKRFSASPATIEIKKQADVRDYEIFPKSSKK